MPRATHCRAPREAGAAIPAQWTPARPCVHLSRHRLPATGAHPCVDTVFSAPKTPAVARTHRRHGRANVTRGRMDQTVGQAMLAISLIPRVQATGPAGVKVTPLFRQAELDLRRLSGSDQVQPPSSRQSRLRFLRAAAIGPDRPDCHLSTRIYRG
jgi:hypothetical protein